MAVLLVASACSGGAETTTPAITVASTTISTTATLAPTATQAPTTTTTPPTTTSPPTTTTPPTTRVAYDREDWGSWADADGDCINTRHEVLILESFIEVEMDPTGCKVVSGRWFDPFSGTSITDPSLIDIDHFVPHQANLRISQTVGDKAKIPPEKILHSIQHYGNTTAATIPLTLDHYRTEGRVKSGDLILASVFGSGYTWGAAIFRLG